MSIRLTRKSPTVRPLVAMLLIALLGGLITPPAVRAETVLDLPEPGSLVTLSAPYAPAQLMGINVDPHRPLAFDFIIDQGDDRLEGDHLQQEGARLVKYFLASLTVPEDEMWVNLSPYEENRIIPADFGRTQMGRDLLALDYMLKQLSSTLMHPDDRLGSDFWQRVYQKAQERFGTTDIPVNTFNKIWIVPEQATVYEHPGGAFIVDSHLKVMLEEDYLALQANQDSTKHGLGDMTVDKVEVISGVSGEIVRSVLLPEIEREVNSGRTFAKLRQIYHAMLLASWYKKRLKESFLGQIYVDKKRVEGIDIRDREINHKIYEQYVASFKKGVFNLIKEDTDPETHEVIPRKYFSGGVELNGDQATLSAVDTAGDAALREHVRSAARRLQAGLRMTVGLNEAGPQRSDRAMLSHDQAVVEGVAQRVAREETDESSEAFRQWYDEILGAFRLRFGMISGYLEGDDAHSLEAYLQFNRNDVINLFDARNLLKKTDDSGRPTLLELGSGDTRVALAIAQRNPGMDVIATDVWQTDPKDSLRQYVVDARAFEDGLLPAQTTPLSNLAAVRAQADLIGHLPDGSLDYILLVNPSRGAIYDLVVMAREFGLADKLRPGGQIIMKATNAVEPFFNLMNDSFHFLAVDDFEFLGVDLHAESAWQEDFLKGNVYVGSRLEDMLGELYQLDVPRQKIGDNAVLAMVADMATRYHMESNMVESIIANNLDVDIFVGGLITEIKRRNPASEMTPEAMQKYLRRRGYLIAGILDQQVVSEAFNMIEEPVNPEDDPWVYAIDGDAYQTILRGALNTGSMARQLARMRGVARKLWDLRTGVGMYMKSAGPHTRKYLDEMNAADRQRVAEIQQIYGVSESVAVARLLNQKDVDERQRVAIRSMEHTASAAVDPFGKLSVLATWFATAAMVGDFDTTVRAEFQGLHRDLQQLNLALRAFASQDPMQPDFRYTRIYDFEARWQSLERTIRDYMGLIREVAQRPTTQLEDSEHMVDRMSELIEGIGNDFASQMAFALGDVEYNRQRTDIADTVRAVVRRLSEDRGFRDNYVRIDVTPAAEGMTVNVNPGWLSLIVSNFVNNAHDEIYKQVVTGDRTDFADGDIRITLDYLPRTGRAILRVHDKARGIDPESPILEKKFGRPKIYRLGGTIGKSAATGSGTGVGLAEVYHIARMMDWELALNPQKKFNGGDAMGAEFTVTIPDVTAKSDNAVLTNVRTVARQFEMDEGVVQGIMASNIPVDRLVRELLKTIRRRNALTQLDEPAILRQLTEKGLVRDDLLSKDFLNGNLVLTEPDVVEGLEADRYAVSDAELDDIVTDTLTMESFAMQVIRMRAVAQDKDRVASITETDLADIGAHLEEYLSQLNAQERGQVDFLTNDEGLSRTEAVAWVLGEKMIEERRRVAVQSMHHSASAAVDPFEKLGSLGGLFGLAATLSDYGEADKERFRAMSNTIDQFKARLGAFARDASEPQFNYQRIYALESIWRKLLGPLSEFVGLFRGQAARFDTDSVTNKFIADQTVSLIQGINADLQGQIAFAQGNLTFNRDRINLAATIKSAAEELSLKRGYPKDLISIEISSDAQTAELDINPVWVSLIVTNLIKNAYDELSKQVATGTRAGLRSGEIRVSLNYFERANQLELAVHDAAGGIAADSPLLAQRLGRERIFELGQTAGKERGTGVGLAEVYHISRLMRWPLELTPQGVMPNSDAFGARFALTIPYKPGEADSAVLAGRQDEVGGIDMNPALADIRFTAADGAVPASFDRLPAALDIEVEGFVPVILNAVPIRNIPLLLGLD